MSKKILSVLISIFLCLSFFGITCYATNNSEAPSSSVTFKINMTEKMKAYYAEIEIKIARLTTDEQIDKIYYFSAPDYADFSVTTTLPNGNYVLLSAYIPNDLDHSPAPTQKFTVGEKSHLVVEAEVKKDMSAYPDRTTVPETTTLITESSSQLQQETTDVPTSVTSVSNEITTLSLDKNTKNTSLSWFQILVPIIIIIAGGFAIFIVAKKIKENRDNPSV